MADIENSGKGWLWGITISISSFILFFIGFAIWTFQGDVELVYKNYYDKDIVFEQQIKSVDRTQKLPVKPIMDYDQTTEILMVKFPAEMGHVDPRGELLLYRPADLHKDRRVPLALEGDTLQNVPLVNLDPGLWRIKLSWVNGAEAYYLEKQIYIMQSP
ncbi:FixH family protein [bacterium]|nr:FixH family protein [bacterium]